MRLFRRPKAQVVAYRFAMGRPAERAWLIHRLGSYGLLQRIETDEQRHRHNMGIELLEDLGLLQGDNWQRLVDYMMTLPIPDEAIETESKAR